MLPAQWFASDFGHGTWGHEVWGQEVEWVPIANVLATSKLRLSRRRTAVPLLKINPQSTSPPQLRCLCQVFQPDCKPPVWSTKLKIQSSHQLVKHLPCSSCAAPPPNIKYWWINDKSMPCKENQLQNHLTHPLCTVTDWQKIGKFTLGFVAVRCLYLKLFKALHNKRCYMIFVQINLTLGVVLYLYV